MCQASKKIVWATCWMQEVEFDQIADLLICLLGDNQGYFDLIKNSEHHSRTKHIDIQYHYICKVAEDGLISMIYAATKEIIANVLIKSIKPAIFFYLRDKLGLIKVEF